MTFDQEKANVSLRSVQTEEPLGYSKDCSEPGTWHFDDVDSPTKIVLCDDTCELTKSANAPSLQVEFGCERRAGSVR